jgi:hypothetical protein
LEQLHSGFSSSGCGSRVSTQSTENSWASERNSRCHRDCNKHVTYL